LFGKKDTSNVGTMQTQSQPLQPQPPLQSTNQPKIGGKNSRNNGSKNTKIAKGKTSSTIANAIKEMKKIKYKSGKLMKGGCDCNLPVN
jgi:hypothetical protein